METLTYDSSIIKPADVCHEIYASHLLVYSLTVLDMSTWSTYEHTDSECKRKYNPDAIRKEEHKDWNMMCAEQTFVWLSRY